MKRLGLGHASTASAGSELAGQQRRRRGRRAVQHNGHLALRNAVQPQLATVARRCGAHKGAFVASQIESNRSKGID